MHPLLNHFADFLRQEDLLDKTWVVGGAIRDNILKRHYYDVDLVIQTDRIFQLSERFSYLYNCSYVHLDKDFLVSRVISDKYFLDISKLKYYDINLDLSERDLTINAMAEPLTDFLTDPLSSIYDPYNGRLDIENAVIRIISTENLIKDPLRLIRIFRFASLFNFAIDKYTRDFACKLVQLIDDVAVERVLYELRQILLNKNSLKAIDDMAQIGLLSHIISEFCDSQLEVYKNTEKLIDVYLSNISDESILFCLKFASLIDNLQSCKINCERLRLSKKDSLYVKTIMKLSRIFINAYNADNTITDRSIIDALKEPDSLIYTSLCLSEAVCSDGKEYFRNIFNFYKGEFKQRQRLLPIVTGYEVMQTLQLQSSRLVGEIIEEVEYALLSGRIVSKVQAFELMRQIFKVSNAYDG